MESARDNGIFGLAHGMGRAFLGFVLQAVSGALDFFSLAVNGIGASCSWCLESLNNKTTLQRISLGRAFMGFVLQPVSGALDLFSLTVDGIGASCPWCLEILNNKTTMHRIRNRTLIRDDNVLTEYCEREAVGQMALYLAEASRYFGCTELFREPSKFAWSDNYGDHLVVIYRRFVLITNKRIMLLQCLAPDKMDKKPCKILWDVSWEELVALELAKTCYSRQSYLILQLKKF